MSELRDIRGPSAFGGPWRRFVHLTWLIASTEFRLTYFGSALGYLWSLMRPLMLFGVLYVVFSQIVDFGDDIRNYPVLLLLNIVCFTFFQEATSTAVSSVLQRESLVRKMHFPRMVIPLSVVLTACLNLAVNLVAVFGFVLAYGVDVRWTWLLLPLGLIPLIVFTLGVAMTLSALYVRFRDVAPIWAVSATALFYGTPVLYAIDTVPDSAREYVLYNPIACILEQLRKWIIDDRARGFADILGGQWWVPVAIFLAVVAAGFAIFDREAPRIAEAL